MIWPPAHHWRTALLFAATCLLLPLNGSAAELSDLVGGELTKVVGDCRFTEGPAWHPDGYLLFSDIPNERIIKVNPDGSSSDWMNPSGGANGLMCDQSGNVYACQGEEQRVALLRSGKDGSGQLVSVLASQYDGKSLNKPNDLALDSAGGLYFTDPFYSQGEPPQPLEGVYYIARTGEVTRVVDGLPRPNGVLVSPDGAYLYVANINERELVRYPIQEAGKLGDKEVLFTGDEELDGRGPDGMAFDENGTLYTTYKKLVVLSYDGELIGRIDVPEKPANCAFGGADNRTLYITARTSLYSLPMKVAGMALQASGPGAGSEKTREVKAEKLTLQVPESWEQQQPSNNLRLAQFAIPPVKGDDEGAELVVFPPFGGSIPQNIQRWITQFESEGLRTKMTQGSTSQGDYVLVDLQGTYKKPDGPPFLRRTKPAPDYRMIAVIFSARAGGNYFLKVTGPKATVGANTDAFRATFGGKAADESEYEL
ncbi:MAG: SMP-30/gluconolactonase/LRE family protein [Maioricimonas sp. JB049]